MQRYRVWRLRESQRQHFRNQEHKGGPATVKPKDYHEGPELEGANPYELWERLKEGEDALQVGDLLAEESGKLLIYKYIGFEPAEWLVIEPKESIDDKGALATDRTVDSSITIG